MTNTRKGDWFVTFTGRRFYPLDPRVEDIDILDIAHALSLQTRWNGHCKTFYSIASHSLACLKVAETEGRSEEARRWALMHDTAEAYTGDIIRPIKRSLGVIEGSEGPAEGMRLFPFQRLEDALLRIIAERFGLPWPMPDVVHTIDNRMLVTEAVNLTNYEQAEHWIYEKPWAHIKPYANDQVLLHQTPEMAKEAFLRLAKEYLSL
jgi:5'-deoxynucleotidase YfbR-like HD superfamily hydrolase